WRSPYCIASTFTVSACHAHWRGFAPPECLEEDRGGDGVVAAERDQLDRAMEVGLASCQLLGERKGIAGLDQHMKTPAFDLRSLSFVLHFDRLGLGHASLLVASGSSFV